jgi:sterol desaturase/sphingolipid hydroxylase (fatty acid hydroxylase superfamily)
MTAQILGWSLALIPLTGFFVLIGYLAPAVPGQPVMRRGYFIDVAFWLLNGIIIRSVNRWLFVTTVIVIGGFLGAQLTESSLLGGFGPLGALPFWSQAVITIVLLDFMTYWKHRMMHVVPWLWPIHAVHHSSTEMDWLSSTRVHPFDDLIERVVQSGTLMLIGLRADAVLMVLPLLLFFVLITHANVNWTYGPLRWVIVSPAFHRWHHDMGSEGRDRNFAGIFCLWDLLFGTYYMPVARQPERLGTQDPLPESLHGQLIYPIRRWARGR